MFEEFILPILAVGVVLVGLGGAYVVSRNYKTVSPSDLMVISGRRGTRFVTGGATLVLPLLEKFWIIPKRVMTLDIIKENVQTIQLVPIDVKTVVQIQLKATDEGYRNAVNAFLGMDEEEIKARIEPTLEGHIRGVCASLEVADLQKNRDVVNKNVLDNSKEDLEKLGLDLKSFQITEIKDSKTTTADGRGYIDSLFAKDLANKRRDAEIAEADASSQSRKAIALADQAAAEQENSSLAKKAEFEKDMKIKKAEYDKLTNIQRAMADKAGEIETSKQQQVVMSENMKIQLVQKQREVEIAEQEKLRRQKEGEAEKLKMIAMAEGESEQKRWEGVGEAEASKAKLLAEAEGNKARLLANAAGTEANLLAEAAGTKAKLLAEAEGIDKKADAYKKLNDAGLEIMKIQMLPEIAGRIAEPLSRIGDKITIVQTPGNSADTMGIGGAILGTIEQAAATLPAIFKAVGATAPKTAKEEPAPVA